MPSVTVKRHSLQTMSEQSFTNAVLDWAKVYGWRRFHVRNSGARGISQVQGDKGFPDLVLVKGSRLIFAELKVGKEQPKPEQLAWLADLGVIGMADVTTFNESPKSQFIPTLTTPETYVWRPEQWSEILVVLARK